MKWIGQHIWDYISRFRDDVYLEDLSTTTETNVLVVDSSGKVSKSTTLADDIIESEIDTLPGLTSFGSAGATTEILAGDLHMFNAVNGGNPIIRLGSSGSDNLLIQAVYNSGVQTLDEVNFMTVTSSGTTNDGRFQFYVDGVQLFRILDGGIVTFGNGTWNDADAEILVNNTTASSATQGGKLRLRSDDDAAMGDDHRLGVIEFEGAEDASNNRTIGARIEAMTEAAWSASENGGRLDFYTTDGNASESKVLTLDSDKLATFTGAVTVTGALTMPDDTVTFAKASGVSPNVYGNIIKILPSDFMINDDAASPLSFKDGSNSGLHVNDAASEAIAFIAIPEGMKATHVDVYGTHNKTLKVWEVDVDATFDFTGTTKGTGAMNTQLDITDVNATADNFLAIQVTLTATSQRIWGGKVTIAAQ